VYLFIYFWNICSWTCLPGAQSSGRNGIRSPVSCERYLSRFLFAVVKLSGVSLFSSVDPELCKILMCPNVSMSGFFHIVQNLVHYLLLKRRHWR